MLRAVLSLVPRLVFGMGPASIFGSDDDSVKAEPTDADAVDAKERRLHIMELIGSGELSVDDAKALYGENLEGLDEPTELPFLTRPDQDRGRGQR